MKTCVEIRTEAATIVAEARKNFELAETREGGLTQQDQDTFDAAMDLADKRLAEARRMEKFENISGELERPLERRSRPIEEESREARQAETKDQRRERKNKIKADYRHWCRSGEIRESLVREHRQGENREEFRDVIISTSSAGGYLITPTQISDDIVRQMDNLVYIRELCRASGSITTVTSAQKLGIRQKTVRMNPGEWTTEIGNVIPDQSMTFGRRDLEPQQLVKLALVSNRTLMLSPDADREVNDELAYELGIAQENGFINGSGTNQALGIFTASANGIPTTQDTACASATVIAGDDLINLKFSLKQVYLKGPSVSWILHRNVVKNIRKIKMSSTGGTAGDQQYIWSPGLTEGAPDRILDLPYAMTEYAPSTQTSGLYVAVLGNFKYYRIAELPQIMIQRLVELYQATGEIGFKATHFVDGSPVLGEAFARLKMA